MKLRILTKRQIAAEAAALKKEHLVRCDLMKLCGRLLAVTREARDYLKQLEWEGRFEATAKTISYDDLMARLNSILERKEWNP